MKYRIKPDHYGGAIPELRGRTYKVEKLVLDLWFWQLWERVDFWLTMEEAERLISHLKEKPIYK